MKKSLTIEIGVCDPCTHSDVGRAVYCTHPKNPEGGKPLYVASVAIPNWCPLPDAPTPQPDSCPKCSETEPVLHCENCGQNWPRNSRPAYTDWEREAQPEDGEKNTYRYAGIADKETEERHKRLFDGTD